MIASKNIAKIIVITSVVAVFYSQIVIWQNYLTKRPGNDPESDFMDPQYHLRRGMELGLEDEFHNAIKLSPTDFNAYYKLANYYAAKNMIKQANELYTKALLIAQGQSKITVFEGIYKNRTHDYFVMGSIAPMSADVRHSFGEFLWYRARYDESVKEFKKALILADRTGRTDIKAPCFNWVGLFYVHKNRHDLAIGYFKAAIKINNANAQFFYNLGASYFQAGQIDYAEQAFKKAIIRNSAMGPAYFYLGLISERKNIKNMARDNYKKALKYDLDAYMRSEADTALKQL